MNERDLDLALKIFRRELEAQYDSQLETAVKDAAEARASAQKAREEAAAAREGMRIAEERLSKTLDAGIAEARDSVAGAKGAAGAAVAALAGTRESIDAAQLNMASVAFETRAHVDKAIAELQGAEATARGTLQGGIETLRARQSDALLAVSRDLDGRMKVVEEVSTRLNADLPRGLEVMQGELARGLGEVGVKADEALRAAREVAERETPKSENLASMSVRVDGMVARIEEMAGVVDAVQRQGHPALNKVAGLEAALSELRMSTQRAYDGMDRSLDAGLGRVREGEAGLRDALRNEVEGKVERMDERITELFASLDAQVKDSAALIAAMKQDARALKTALGGFGEAA